VTHAPFADRVEREFIIGSGIQPTLYQAATSLVEDTELGLAVRSLSDPRSPQLAPDALWPSGTADPPGRFTLQRRWLHLASQTERTPHRCQRQSAEIRNAGGQWCQGVSAASPTRHPATHQRALRD
jgi:hypothetical protein